MTILKEFDSDLVSDDLDSEPVLLVLKNWVIMASMMFYSEDAQEELLFYSSAIAGALFGAVHCNAWYFVFPSYVEKVMWRVASLTFVSSCVCFSLTVCIFSLDIPNFGTGVAKKLFEVLLGSFIFFLSFLSLLLYPISRTCLLVLALTSLRSLPPSAFDTVHWIELIPHI